MAAEAHRPPRAPAAAGRLLSTPAPPPPLVRLDSLDPRRGARSFRFGGFRRVVAAWRLGDVVPALAEVERAVRDGLHAAGFVAYEAAPAFDPALATHPPDPRLPLAWFALFEEREQADPPSESTEDGFALGEWTAELAEEAYRDRVERIREWIAAGDSYQVNLTFPLRAPFAGDARALYRRLCLAQRGDFHAHLEIGGGITIVSASPELFFRWTGDALEMRPMKGTRPRGRWAEEDEALAADLVASGKDRAENLMIVDLLRNDAGRVAEFGSVRVDRLFEVERYETVHQMTSTLHARTRPGATLADVFGALFPCGSVTGAPKVRTSRIIVETEDGPRGVYCGAVGFVSPDEAVFNVAIRTLVIDHAAGTAELGVGSGITFDSDAEAERRECLDKAEFARRPPHAFHLLETILHEPGAGFFLLDGHLDRLAASAARFGFAFDEDEIRGRLEEAIDGSVRVPLRVRLLLSREGRITIESHPVGPSPDPVRVAVSAEAVDSGERLLYHKTTRREVYETRKRARPDVDDVLLVNERGELTESTIANLVVEIAGARWTPPRESGLLPGVFRADLLRRGQVRERVLRPEELARADAVWLVNSVRRWRRAVVVP